MGTAKIMAPFFLIIVARKPYRSRKAQQDSSVSNSPVTFLFCHKKSWSDSQEGAEFSHDPKTMSVCPNDPKTMSETLPVCPNDPKTMSETLRQRELEMMRHGELNMKMKNANICSELRMSRWEEIRRHEGSHGLKQCC